MSGEGVYPWTLAAGVVVLVVGLVVIANGYAAAGVLVSLVGAVLVVGSLIARGARVRAQRHEELLAELRKREES